MSVGNASADGDGEAGGVGSVGSERWWGQAYEAGAGMPKKRIHANPVHASVGRWLVAAGGAEGAGGCLLAARGTRAVCDAGSGGAEWSVPTRGGQHWRRAERAADHHMHHGCRTGGSRELAGTHGSARRASKSSGRRAAGSTLPLCCSAHRAKGRTLAGEGMLPTASPGELRGSQHTVRPAHWRRARALRTPGRPERPCRSWRAARAARPLQHSTASGRQARRASLASPRLLACPLRPLRAPLPAPGGPEARLATSATSRRPDPVGRARTPDGAAHVPARRAVGTGAGVTCLIKRPGPQAALLARVDRPLAAVSLG